jgi:3-methyladenine DNA glycosylase AlkD
MVDVIAEADLITAELRSLSGETVDPSPIIVTRLPFYGVSLDHLRRVARAWHRAHAGATAAEVVALADALWERAVREEMVVAAMLLGRDPATRSAAGVRRLDRWGALLDNWETTDNLGGRAVGPAVADDPAGRFALLHTLSLRRNPWLRRLALVACTRVGRLPDAAEWWPQTVEIVLRLAGDREGGIPKAISWVLRTHLRHAEPEVALLLAAHAAELPAIAVRETRTKMATGTKSGRRRRS